MSFINWGNESPEQRAIRAKLEQEALYEQAVRMSQARNRGNNSQSGGAASGGALGIPDQGYAFYGYGFIAPNIGVFTGIDENGNLTQIGSTQFNDFNGVTVFCYNPDNKKMYYVSQDMLVNEMVVGTINLKTGALTEIDRVELTSLNYSPPCSLVYIGNSAFVYVANNTFLGEFGTTQDLIEIEIVGNNVTASLLSTYDTEVLGLAITGVAPFAGEYWAAVSSTSFPPLAGFGKIDLATASLTDANPAALVGFPFAEIYKVVFSIGISQSSSGKVYLNQYVIDKDTGDEYVIIAEADPVNYETTYLLNIVQTDFVPIDIETTQ